MKFLKLNEDGVAHYLLGALVVALIAAVGVKVVTSSHAETPASGATASSNEIVYVNGSSNIYEIQGNGSDNQQVYAPADGANAQQSITWGENGSSVFFWNGDSIDSVSSTGSNLKTIAKLPGGTGATISWSEAAQKLAYAKAKNNKKIAAGSIYTSDADGSHNKLIYTFPASEDQEIDNIQWSPNGQKILVSTSGISSNNSNGLYIVNANGTHITPYVSSSNQVSFGPNAWSPDSSSIVYTTGATITEENIASYKTTTLYTVNSTGSSAYTLYRPSWSPDGTKIAFIDDAITSPNSTFSLDYMTASGGTPQTITSITGPQQNTGIGKFDWSPNSSQIAYEWNNETQGGALSTIDINGTNSVVISQNNNNASSFDWSVQ